MRIFFVVYTQRTGSTTLWLHLAQHSKIVAIGDVFQKKNLHEALWDGTLGRMNNPTLGINDYIDFLLGALAEENTKALGVKCSYGLLTNDLLKWMRDNKPHIIHVERENKVRQEISLQLAKARRKFHLLPGETVKQVPIHINISHLHKRITRVKDMNRKIVNLFSSRFPYIRITYEDFIAKTDSVVNRICDFLDVPHMDSLPLPTKKISPRDLSTVIKNYNQIKGLL